MLFQIFHDVRINYTLCFIGKSIFCSYYFSVLSFPLQKYNIFLNCARIWWGFLENFRSVGGFSSGVFRLMGTITLRFSFGVASVFLRRSSDEVPMKEYRSNSEGKAKRECALTAKKAKRYRAHIAENSARKPTHTPKIFQKSSSYPCIIQKNVVLLQRKG